MHGRFAEGEDHLAEPLGQSLARPQVKGHPLPTPIVDEQLHGHVGLGGAAGIYPGLLAVAADWITAGSAWSVLAPHAAFPRLVFIGQVGGLEHLGFLVAHGLGVKPPRRFHGGEGQHLGQVVLHHVAQGPRAFVVAGPLFHSDRFSGRDLHAGDVVAVPDRFENGVGEAQHQDVLDRFLAQVVVDPEDLVFLCRALHHPVQLLGAAVIAAKGLLDHHPTPGGILQQPCGGEGPTATAVEIWGYREVEGAVAPGGPLAINHLEAAAQANHRLGIFQIHGFIEEPG